MTREGDSGSMRNKGEKIQKKKMVKKLRILMLEDVATDAELVEHELCKAKIAFTSKCVKTKKVFTKTLKAFKPGIILADFNLPSFDGLSALKIAKQLSPEIPFIFVSGAIGEEFVIDSLKKGATDYVLKNRLKRLAPAVRRALQEVEERAERKRAEKALQEREEKFRTIFENANDAIIYVNKYGKIIDVNKRVEDIFGYKRVETIGKNFMKLNIFKLKDLPRIIKLFKESVKKGRVIDTTGKGTNIMELKIKRKNGDIAFVEASSTAFKKEGKLMGYLSILHDITERRKAEKALLESEEQFRTFAENVPGVVTIYDIYPDGRRVAIYISPGVKELLGDATAEKIGYNIDSFFELIHPDDLEQLQKAADFAQASGQALDHEYRVRRIDSEEYKWVRSTGISSPMGNGVIRWQGQLFDLTEPKQVEKRERQHIRNLAYLSKTALEFVALPPERNIFKHIAERIKEIAGNSIVVISSFDEGSRLLQCRSVVGLGKFTNRFLKLLGRDPLEICIPISEEAERGLRKGNFVKIPGGFYVFTLGQIPEKACKAIEKLLGLENIYAHGISKEGTLFGAAILLTRTKTDIKNRTVIETFISQASTALQHRLAEEGLRKSEEKFRLLVENLPQKIFFKDKNSVYISCNKNYARDFKIEPDKIAGKTDNDFYPKELAEKYRAEDKRIIESGNIEDIEEKNIVNGQEVFVHMVKTPVKDDHCNVIGILGIFWDITERKKLEKQLLHSQKMEAIGQLAGGIAHDFNNLLTAIKGYSELLLHRIGSNDPLRKDIKQIKKIVSHGSSLIQQLLVFSSRQILQSEKLYLNKVVMSIEEMLQRLIGTNIELVTVLGKKLNPVKADIGQIEQVIMNLVVNARDAMPDGGTLIIKTENVTIDEEYCKVFPEAKQGKFVCLSIEDTGIGMDKETIQHIFEPFYSTKGRGKGTGLGLSTVYGIVKQHKGWINVYSEPKQGTTFKTYLATYSKEPKEETKKTIPLQKLRGNGERILIVDDDKDILKFVTRALSENGYIISEAENANEALKVFEKEKEKFNLVFSDVVMPDKSGLELVEQLLSRNDELKVILTSGYTDQKSELSLIREKGFSFLQKPFNLIDLLQAVKKAIDKR